MLSHIGQASTNRSILWVDTSSLEIKVATQLTVLDLCYYTAKLFKFNAQPWLTVQHLNLLSFTWKSFESDVINQDRSQQVT